MKMKQNQTSLHGAYLNLTAYLFLYQNTVVFPWLSKLGFLSFMTKVNPCNENETKWDIFKSDTFFYQNLLKYFNEYQNQNFSILWLKWTQAMEMKQNHTFFQGTYSNLTLFSLVVKILKYFNDFYNWHFSISWQKWAQSNKVE